jgi:chaperonin cofactor prefoldin
MITKQEIEELIEALKWLDSDAPVYRDVISTIKEFAKRKGIKEI